MIVTAPGGLSPSPPQTLCCLTVYQARIITAPLVFSKPPCYKSKEELVTLTPWLPHPSLMLSMPLANLE